MKITILSGGSGNDSLVRGLRRLSKDIDVKVVVNCYDNGKSTGVCRTVTNTLGVSDVRKNHSRMYEAMSPNPDRRLLDFYKKRYDFGSFTETNDPAKNALAAYDDLCLDAKINENSFSLNVKDYIKEFFDSELATKFSYNDFSLANIVYSSMYRSKGYEYTNSYFCNILGLSDFVLLNSFDNVFINAMLDNGVALTDEGDIVELSSSDVKIVDTFYSNMPKYCTLNDKAIEAIMNCDLLLISTGTFWSSIYPTLQYGNMVKHVNASKAKKIWAMNNECDKDSYGVYANDFIAIVKNLGLSLDDFTILANADANKLMIPTAFENTVCVSMGNDSKGRHDSKLFAKEVLKCYYGITEKYDKYLFDFDDTLWARDEDSNSQENIRLLSELDDNAIIVSGNSYEKIRPKVYSVMGRDLNTRIWTLAEGTCFSKDVVVDNLPELALHKESLEEIVTTLTSLGVDYSKIKFYGDPVVNVRVKPLTGLERTLLAKYLNDTLKLRVEARVAGRTTVDIVDKMNTKERVFEHCNLRGCRTLYIGDEVDKGNDADIAKMCTHSIHTSGAYETNTLLKLILEK